MADVIAEVCVVADVIAEVCVVADVIAEVCVRVVTFVTGETKYNPHPAIAKMTTTTIAASATVVETPRVDNFMSDIPLMHLNKYYDFGEDDPSKYILCYGVFTSLTQRMQ